MVLSLLRVGRDALQTMSKPIATVIEKAAHRHPGFKSLLIRMDQIDDRITKTMQRCIYGQSIAAKSASDVMAFEVFFYSVGAAVLIFQAQKCARVRAEIKEHKREYERIKERLEQKIAKYGSEEVLKQKIAEIEQARNNGRI